MTRDEIQALVGKDLLDAFNEHCRKGQRPWAKLRCSAEEARAQLVEACGTGEFEPADVSAEWAQKMAFPIGDAAVPEARDTTPAPAAAKATKTRGPSVKARVAALFDKVGTSRTKSELMKSIPNAT